MFDEMHLPDEQSDPLRPRVLEGFARVVALEGSRVWLEPEQTTSCGACASSGACGAKGIGTIASRLELRRFAMVNEPGLTVGERIVVGVSERALLRASGAAYAIPLAVSLGAGALAQWAKGSDGITMAATLGGLALGLLASRLAADWLNARGQLAPHFLRRAGANENCQIN